MTDNTQPEALRLAGFLDKLDVRTVDRIQNCVSAAAELRRQHARIVELESQLASIGAGGVSQLMGAAGDAGWQPIETAPKGASVLLYCGGSVAPIYCGVKRHGLLGEPQQDVFAWRCDSSGRFATPTHWHPTPLPPSSAKGVAL